MKNILRFLKEEDGVTAIEYGLIASLIAVASIGAITGVATAFQGAMDSAATSLR